MVDMQFTAGALVFVPSEADGWEAVRVVDCKGFGENATVRAAPINEPSAIRTLAKEEVVQVEESDALALQGAPDMVKFSKLSEATLLHNLRVRYARDDIYTRSGSILLSVNPFKELSIYTPEHMARCKVHLPHRRCHTPPRDCNPRALLPAELVTPPSFAGATPFSPIAWPMLSLPFCPLPPVPLRCPPLLGAPSTRLAPEARPSAAAFRSFSRPFAPFDAQDADAKQLQDLPPHVYALAEAAYRGMLIEQKQQAILISGESGAGKTEAVKACLRHVVSRSSDAARELAPRMDGGSGSLADRAGFVQDCIMQANPLLEALGNAKTVRNGNSSRFGKWVEVQFDASGFITASRVTSYLLEKSRVTEHAEGERTYHILYQLCRGCTKEQSTELHLLPAADFRFIGESAAIQVPNVDDKQWWAATCHAMGVFGMAGNDQVGVRAILASVLHLGNLSFATVQMAQQDDGSQVDATSKAQLSAAAELLGLDLAALEQALTVKSVGKFPVVHVPQPPSKAAATRDALSKALYGQLFDWTISRINGTMAGVGSADAKRTIGMLDIFGFEAFVRNSLEQLLINFANEKLQAHFNEYIFRQEEAECRAEGVACPTLQFADNSAVMTLMTAKPTGVLSLINEEVLVPNASDANLLQKLMQQHRSNSEFRPLPRSQGEGFIITHYAGPVSYVIDGFVDKNRDALPGELLQLVGSSQMPLLSALFKQGGAADPDAAPKSARGGGARGRTGGGGRRVSALASQFADSLDALISMLQATTPHFVRCVKPNAKLASDQLDGVYVMRQLREMGMVHVVRARKQGYAHRYSFDRFNVRYGYLVKGRDVSTAACAAAYAQHLGSATPPVGARRDCVTVLAMMVSDGVLDAGGWAVGTGKVFLKEAQQQQLEVAREAYLLKVVTEQLQAAITQREVPALEMAIAAAVEVQLQSPLIAKAQQLLALLQAQFVAMAKLQEAIAVRDLGSLDNALEAAAKVGLANEVVQQAQAMRAQLLAQQQATVALTEALQRNDISAITAALDGASRAGLNTGLVKEAERRLELLQQVAELEQQLRRASEQDNLSALNQLLSQAEMVNLTTDAVRVARERRAALQEAIQMQEHLTQAMQGGDARNMRSLVASARQLRVQPADLVAAADAAERAAIEAESAAAAFAVEEARNQRDAEAAERAAEDRAAADRAAADRAAADRAAQERAAPAAPPPAPPPSALSLDPRSPGRSIPNYSSEPWVESKEFGKVLPCVPLAKRVELLQRGSTLVKVAPAADRWKERAMPACVGGRMAGTGCVCFLLCCLTVPLPNHRNLTHALALDLQVAEGGWARHRYTNKWVQLSGDARQVLWDEGRKSVDLSQVMRISIGIETRTLQRLYSSSSSRLSGGGIPDDVSSHHWFSLHTSSRSFDFGATQQNAEFGDENETVVLWVLTLQQLVASRLVPDAVAGSCLALSNAQYQWQRFDVAGKEWPCLLCTYHNPPDSPVCGVCTKPRPMVTVNPCLTPLLPALKAMDKTLGLDVFEDAGNDTQRPEAHLLWFLVQAVESAALPRPFEWAARCQPSAPDEHHLVMATYDGPSYEDAKHPYIAELRKRAVDLSAQLLANGGQPDFSAFSSPKFVAPLDSPHSSSADGESEMGTWRQSMANEIATAGFSQHEFEEALAAASLHEASQQQPQQQQPQQPEQLGTSASFEDAPGQLDAAVVFRHCMSGSIHELERFLSLGGHADTVYKSDYGWDVGPDWTFTKPNDGTTCAAGNANLPLFPCSLLNLSVFASCAGCQRAQLRCHVVGRYRRDGAAACNAAFAKRCRPRERRRAGSVVHALAQCCGQWRERAGRCDA